MQLSQTAWFRPGNIQGNLTLIGMLPCLMDISMDVFLPLYNDVT